MARYENGVEVRVEQSGGLDIHIPAMVATVEDRTMPIRLVAMRMRNCAVALPSQGERLRALRRAHGVTATSVARLLGTHRVTIEKLERGNSLRSSWIRPLCQLYGVQESDVTGDGLVTIPRDESPLTARIAAWRDVRDVSLPDIAEMTGIPYDAVRDLATGRRKRSAYIATLERYMHGEDAAA